MFNSLYNAKFSDLDLPKPTRMGFDTIDWEEEIEALMSEMCEYEGSRIYGALGMIAMGVCPECCGNSCMDADYENGEDSCSGSYSYDCDEGEMHDAPWLSLYKYESFQVALEKRMEYKGDDPNEFWHLFRLEDEVGLKELIAAAQREKR